MNITQNNPTAGERDVGASPALGIHHSQLSGSPLAATDLMYLDDNVSISLEGGGNDPQAQRLYGVEAHYIDHATPVWTRGRMEQEVRRFSLTWGLRVKLRLKDMKESLAYVGNGGGVVLFPQGGAGGMWRSVGPDSYLASLVLHELAHVLTPNTWRRTEAEAGYGSVRFQSHGPEFLRCYLTLLGEYMRIGKIEAFFEHLGMRVASDRAFAQQANGLLRCHWGSGESPAIPGSEMGPSSCFNRSTQAK